MLLCEIIKIWFGETQVRKMRWKVKNKILFFNTLGYHLQDMRYIIKNTLLSFIMCKINYFLVVLRSYLKLFTYTFMCYFLGWRLEESVGWAGKDNFRKNQSCDRTYKNCWEGARQSSKGENKRYSCMFPSFTLLFI